LYIQIGVRINRWQAVGKPSKTLKAKFQKQKRAEILHVKRRFEILFLRASKYGLLLPLHTAILQQESVMSSHVKAAAPRVKGKMTFKAQNRAPVASGSAPKRKRPAPPSDDEMEEDEDEEDFDDEADVESEGDTDDEIATAQAGKSKKTASKCSFHSESSAVCID